MRGDRSKGFPAEEGYLEGETRVRHRSYPSPFIWIGVAAHIIPFDPATRSPAHGTQYRW